MVTAAGRWGSFRGEGAHNIAMTRVADANATDNDRDEPDTQVLTDDVDDVEEYDDEDLLESPPRTLGWILTIGGIVGFIASFMLAIERIAMLQDPNYLPTCSFDSVLQCSSVMASDQGSIFGFSNPLIGLAAFPLVIMAGVLALSRVSLPSWFWRWLLVGAAYGMVFVGWLISQTLYEIRALCPYCMVVWAMVIPIFWRTLTYTLSGGHFGSAIAQNGFVRVLERYWWVLTLATYAVVTTLVLTAFPYYFF
jgi:uncharacterized membrane protein